MRHLGLAMLAAALGCAAQGPERALDEYTRAVQEKDWAKVHALSDQTTRSLMSPDELGAAIERGRPLPGVVGQRHVFELENGGRIVLVREDDGWRVERGAVALARTDTPEAALKTLFFGVRESRLDVVRAVIPSRHLSDLADDGALAKHLEAIGARVRAAAEALEAGDHHAEIDGDDARLTYAPGKTVRFEREKGAWKVVDIE